MRIRTGESDVRIRGTTAPPVLERFFRKVPLPPGLTQKHLILALRRTHEIVYEISQSLMQRTGKPLTAYIQANGFSGLVSNVLTESLGMVSPYKRSHEQEYPDLINPANGTGLEVKAANKPGKGGESHNGHGGWHLIACYRPIRATGNIVFVHLEIAELVGYHDEPEGDWHYCGSSPDEETGTRRTETYYTTLRGTSKLRDGSVYLDTDRVKNWAKWRHARTYPIPPHSPLYFQRIDSKTRVPSPDNPTKLVKWASVKAKLNKLDPLWPLYGRLELQGMGLPVELIDVIRPEKP